MTLALTTRSADGTRAVAAALVPFLREGDVVLLSGELGAGKTVFVQGLANAAGVDEPVTSPTFTLLHGYATTIGLELLHADVYRLETTAEVADLGLAELVEDGAFALVEWGERAVSALGPDHLFVEISPSAEVPDADPDLRRLSVRPVGGTWTARWPALADALRASAEPVKGER